MQAEADRSSAGPSQGRLHPLGGPGGARAGGNYPQSTWLTGGLCLLPDGAGHRAVLCDLLLRDGLIAAIHPAGERDAPCADAQRIDAAGHLVVPGLVNAHTHSPDNLMVGMAPAMRLESWSLACADMRHALFPREVYVSTMLGCIEMLRSGTTTVLDHVRFSNHLDSACLDAVAQAYQDAGMRAVITPVVADRPLIDTLPLQASDFDADTLGASSAPAAAQMPASEQVARVEDFFRRWHGRDGRLYCAIGPSGPQRCTDDLLLRCGAFAQAHATLLHTHVLETRAQQAMAQQMYGRSMITHLDALGLLGPRINLVHAIWVDGADLDCIARSGATVVHNPVSNARLGSGLCPVPAMLHRGIPVALGTDSACCNDSNQLLETAKWAAMVHNSHTADPADWVGPHTALRLATREGAGVLGLGAVTGAIATGLAADLALFDLNTPGLVPLHDPVQQLVLSRAGPQATTVMVAGSVRVSQGRCIDLPEHTLWAEAQDFADKRSKGSSTAHPLTAPVRRMNRRMHALAANAT